MNAINSVATCARPACAKAIFNPKFKRLQSPSTMHTVQRYAKADVSAVSDVQAPVYAGFSRYVPDTADVSAVSATPAIQGCDKVTSTPELLGLMLENILDNAVNRPERTVFSRPEFYGFGRGGLVRKAGRMALSMFSTSRPPVALEKATCGFLSHNGAETMTTVNTPTTSKPDTIARQQAIEDALESALHFIRLTGTPSALYAATGRANRALSMLKQACTDAKKGGAA